MTFPVDPLDVVAELYVGSDWQDITSDVRAKSGISISRGASSEDGRVPPGRCSLTINNRSGDYSPRNALGQWYGSLGRNSPIRLAIRQDRDAFGRTSATGWGSTDTGLVWSEFSAGSSVAADWAVAAGVGTHSVSSVATYRASYLAGVTYRDVDVAVTLQLPFADVTGGDLEPGNILLRGVTTSDYYMVRVVVTSADAVTVKLTHADGTEYASAVTVTGLTHTGQQLRVRTQIEGQTFRAKVWAAGGAEPFGWHVTGRVPDAPRAGWVGVRSGVAAANTNALPVVVSYDDWEVRRPRYAGEVAEWPPRWDVTATEALVPIEANGVLRRLGQGASPLRSALRRSIPAAPGLVAYWPLEDEEGATQFASALPGVAPMDINGPVELAGYDAFTASAPLPMANLGRWTGRLSYTSTGVIQLRWLLSVPSGGTSDGAVLVQVLTAGTAQRWELAYGTGGKLRLRAFGTTGSTLLDTGAVVFELDGQLVRVSIELQHDGADVDYALSTLRVGESTGGGVSGTVAGATVGRALELQFAPGAVLDDVAFGHITVQDEVTDFYALSEELTGYDGETAGTRIGRLCEEQGIPVALFGDPDDTASMGPQGVASLLDLVQECADADRGTLHESRGELGLAYRTRSSMYNQDPTVTIDYSAKQLSMPFEPTDDDQGVRNDVTVRRVGGSSERVELEAGRMSVLDPADGGIGRYDTSVTVNVETDLQLRGIAGWLVHLGTVDELRVPRIAVNLARGAVADTSLASAMLDLDIGDRFQVSNTGGLSLHNGVDQLARGYSEILGGFEHAFEVTGVPASPYDVVELNDSVSKLDSSSSTLDVAATSGAATLSVTSTAERWTTDAGQMPIPITIGGEDMSVTAIGSATPTFVAAGTAAHADNASVSPGLPAGVQAGDLLLLLATARSSLMAPVTPDGYTLLVSYEPVRLYGKYATGSESAPTVTFTGSVAGSTTSAQMAAFRGVSLTVAGSAAQTTSVAAQNIAYPLLALPRGGASLVLWIGRKADDWTSVATISGATEISESSSTSGDDAGIVWDFATFDGAAGSVPAGSFTVTGGTAATSRALVVALYTTQSMTVTRAVNGVSKAHAAGSEVHVSRRATLAL